MTAALCDVKLLLASSALLIGEYELSTGQFDEAHNLYLGLLGGDPSNALWQEGLARAHIGLGNGLVARGDAPGGSGNFSAAIGILQSLVNEDPSNVTFGIRLAQAQAALAESLALRGDLSEARRHTDIATGMVSEWSADAAGGITGSFRLALAWDHIGAVEQSVGNSDSARQAWSRALSMLRDTQQNSPSSQALQARLLYRLGEVEEARALEQEVIGSGLKYSGYLPLSAQTQP